MKKTEREEVKTTTEKKKYGREYMRQYRMDKKDQEYNRRIRKEWSLEKIKKHRKKLNKYEDIINEN